MKKSTFLFALLILFICQANSQTNGENCNVYELLPPIPQGAPSQNDPSQPCGFYPVISPDVYVNQCSPCGRKVLDNNCVFTPNPSLCELDGFETMTGGFTADLSDLARGFCNGAGTIENNFWIGFTAQTNMVEFMVSVGVCTENLGVQVAIVETNCSDEFNTMEGNVPCIFNGIDQGGSQILDANNLVPGNPYYIMVDGFAGDICDLRIDILDGFGIPEYDIMQVLDSQLCPDVTNPDAYTAQPGSGAQVSVETGGIATTDLTFFWLDPEGILLAETAPDNIAGNLVRGSLDGSFFNAPGTHTVEIIDNGSCCPVCTSIDLIIATTPPATASVDSGEIEVLNCSNSLVNVTGNPDDSSTPYVEQWQIAIDPALNNGNTRATVVTSLVSQNGRVNELEVTQDLIANYISGQEFGTATFVYGYLEGLEQLCFSEASIEVSFDFRTPLIEFIPPSELSCENTSTQIDASNTNTFGHSASYSWTFQDNTTNGIVSGGDMPIVTVNRVGSYTLIVTDNENGCQGSVIIEVTGDDIAGTNIPDIQWEQIGGSAGPITCGNTTVEFNGFVGGENPNPNVELTWIDPFGAPLSGNPITIDSSSPEGTYTIEGSVPGEGCTGQSFLNITFDFFEPNVIAEGGIIGCDNTSGVQLMASSSTANVSYLWTSPSGVEFTEQNPLVSQAGTYTLVVTNEDNACTTSVTVEVAADSDVPSVLWEQVSGNTGPISCINPERVLNGFVVGPNQNIEITWFDPQGNPIAGNPITIDENSAEGIYEIQAVNTSNGCSSISTVSITKDFTEPSFELSEGTIFCAPNDNVTISAVDTDPLSPASYTWIAPDGSSPGQGLSNPSVSEPGIYGLIATSDISGCTAEGSIEVLANIEEPNISVAPDFTFTCTNGATTYDLDGSAFTTNSADILEFSWTLNGAVISTEANPNVAEAGTYILTVTNTTNNCMASETVVIEDAVVVLDLQIDITQDLTLTVTATNGVAPFTYLWNDGSITDVVTDPVIGFAYEVTVTDANGCTGVLTEVYQPNSTDQFIITDVSIFPNPSTGIFNLSYDSDMQMQQLRVYDIQGRVVHEQLGLSTSIADQLQLSELAQGTYILEANFAEGVFREKIIILK